MPIVDRLEDELGGRLAVHRLDAAEAPVAALQAEWNIRGHPAFAVVDEQGQVVDRLFGPQSAEVLRQAVAAVNGP